MRTGHRVVILIGLRLESCDWLDPLSDQKPAQWSAKATDKQLHAACFFPPQGVLQGSRVGWGLGVVLKVWLSEHTETYLSTGITAISPHTLVA